MLSNQQEMKMSEAKYPQFAAETNLTFEQRFALYKKAQNKNVSLEDPIRLAAIRQALAKLKEKNKRYLQHIQLNTSWRKIYNGLLGFNSQQQLPKLIELKLCQSKGLQKSFFDPFAKTPISICYNKINLYQIFQKHALFNLILHYDNKVKSSTNWNQIQPTIKSTVRALHISGMCQKSDRKCFQDQIKTRVASKQRFQNIPYDFEKLLQKGLQDFQPISQVMHN